MLKSILPTTMLVPLTWLSNNNMMWINTTSYFSYSFMISLISLSFLYQPFENNLNFSLLFFSDSLLAPLLILTIWLLPLMLMASQQNLSPESNTQKKSYITMIISLQQFLVN